MTAESQVPKDHPLMVAWEAYIKTPDFKNTKKQVAYPEHLQDSLWAVFSAGFKSGHTEGYKGAALRSAEGLEALAREICHLANTHDVDMI